MVFEHFALNVEKPIEVAKWYVDNLEMKIVKGSNKPPYAHFLADKTGRLVIEIYKNDNAEIIDLKIKTSIRISFCIYGKEC